VDSILVAASEVDRRNNGPVLVLKVGSFRQTKTGGSCVVASLATLSANQRGFAMPVSIYRVIHAERIMLCGAVE
jgi:hypothetical protein